MDKRLSVGTWSEGTLRTEDLLEAALDMARSVGYESDRTEEAEHALDAIIEGDDHGCTSEVCAADYADECFSDLADALEEFAPIYCYIGMTEGDGACFGVWPDHDAIDEAIRTSHKIDEGIRESRDAAYYNANDGVIIEVSDHGNVEVWQAVPMFGLPNRFTRGKSLLALV